MQGFCFPSNGWICHVYGCLQFFNSILLFSIPFVIVNSSSRPLLFYNSNSPFLLYVKLTPYFKLTPNCSRQRSFFESPIPFLAYPNFNPIPQILLPTFQQHPHFSSIDNCDTVEHYSSPLHRFNGCNWRPLKDICTYTMGACASSSSKKASNTRENRINTLPSPTFEGSNGTKDQRRSAPTQPLAQ